MALSFKKVVAAVVVAGASLGSSLAAQQMAVAPVGKDTCADVRVLDVNNLTFESGKYLFTFHRGKAHSWDSPDQGSEQEKPDWQAKIERDKIVSPALGIRIRFLLIDNIHETGTGWHYHLVGFRCAPLNSTSDQRLLKVFDRQGMSLRVENLDDHSVTISVATVRDKPTREHWLYEWDTTKEAFSLKKNWTTDQ